MVQKPGKTPGIILNDRFIIQYNFFVRKCALPRWLYHKHQVLVAQLRCPPICLAMSARAPLPILAARRQMRVRSLPQPLLLHDKRCPLAQIGLERRKIANILSLQHVSRVRRAENDVKAAIPARFQQLQAEMGAMPVANHDSWVVWRAIPQHASL